MSTLQHKQLTFNKNITLANDGGKISSDSGLVLIKEFMNRIGFSIILEEQVKLTDSRKNPDHTYNDIIEQLLLQHIAGYSKDVAANRLRLDPIFKTIFPTKALWHHNQRLVAFSKQSQKKLSLSLCRWPSSWQISTTTIRLTAIILLSLLMA